MSNTGVLRLIVGAGVAYATYLMLQDVPGHSNNLGYWRKQYFTQFPLTDGLLEQPKEIPQYVRLMDEKSQYYHIESNGIFYEAGPITLQNKLARKENIIFV